MKTAIVFADGIKQIVLTPENDDEKQALKLITPNDDISLAVKTGTFIDKHAEKPFHAVINCCQGGYLRAFSDEESIMLVLTPKPTKC